MSSSRRLICLSVLFFTLFALTHAAHFDVLNNCDFTVWAAAKPGGGMQLAKGQTWGVDVAPGTTQARIWARTNCNFDANGQGKCETGDCNGKLQCDGYGSPPNTLAEFALNQPNNLDFVDISLVDGFNVGMDFSPATPGVCRDLKCNADINGQCPAQLKVPGGCNNPCTTFKEERYCCNQGQNYWWTNPGCSPGQILQKKNLYKGYSVFFPKHFSLKDDFNRLPSLFSPSPISLQSASISLSAKKKKKKVETEAIFSPPHVQILALPLAATMDPVDQLTCLNSSRIGAQTHTVIPKMILRACSLALPVLITRSHSALHERLSALRFPMYLTKLYRIKVVDRLLINFTVHTNCNKS